MTYERSGLKNICWNLWLLCSSHKYITCNGLVCENGRYCLLNFVIKLSVYTDVGLGSQCSLVPPSPPAMKKICRANFQIIGAHNAINCA